MLVFYGFTNVGNIRTRRGKNHCPDIFVLVLYGMSTKDVLGGLMTEKSKDRPFASPSLRFPMKSVGDRNRKPPLIRRFELERRSELSRNAHYLMSKWHWKSFS